MVSSAEQPVVLSDSAEQPVVLSDSAEQPVPMYTSADVDLDQNPTLAELRARQLKERELKPALLRNGERPRSNGHLQNPKPQPDRRNELQA